MCGQHLGSQLAVDPVPSLGAPGLDSTVPATLGEGTLPPEPQSPVWGEQRSSNPCCLSGTGELMEPRKVF